MSKLNFFVVDQGENKPVEYDKETIVENFIKDYLTKNNIYVTLDPEVYTFKINGKVLNSNKFKDRKLGDLVRKRGKVTLERKKDVHYSLNYIYYL